MLVTTLSTVFPISLIFFRRPEQVLTVLINLYFSIVLYSLYRKFKDEEHEVLPIVQVPSLGVASTSNQTNSSEANQQNFFNIDPLNQQRAELNLFDSPNPPNYSKI